MPYCYDMCECLNREDYKMGMLEGYKWYNADTKLCPICMALSCKKW